MHFFQQLKTKGAVKIDTALHNHNSYRLGIGRLLSCPWTPFSLLKKVGLVLNFIFFFLNTLCLVFAFHLLPVEMILNMTKKYKPDLSIPKLWNLSLDVKYVIWTKPNGLKWCHCYRKQGTWKNPTGLDHKTQDSSWSCTRRCIHS